MLNRHGLLQHKVSVMQTAVKIHDSPLQSYSMQRLPPYFHFLGSAFLSTKSILKLLCRCCLNVK
jgi:hypothetical protein